MLRTDGLSRIAPKALRLAGTAWFVVSTSHGAALMLVPALAPLCRGVAGPASTGASGPLAMALAALGVHAASMLAVAALVMSRTRSCP